jgi:hypothetical protein
MTNLRTIDMLFLDDLLNMGGGDLSINYLQKTRGQPHAK